MNKNTLTAIAVLSFAFSMPAVAGPNWDVIHRAEAIGQSHQHEKALVLPLDYGPRAITTPWVNHVRLGEMVSRTEADGKLAQRQAEQAHARKKPVEVAAHARHPLPNHS